MGRVRGVKEKVHLPLYDALVVAPGQRVAAHTAGARVFRFFTDVQGKTPLETNLHAAGELPRRKSYEVHALRFVVSPVRQWRTEEHAAGSGAIAVHTTLEFLNGIVFESVTRLVVGEKILIEVPTWVFPSSAAGSANADAPAYHAPLDPVTALRFAEPIVIDKGQSFRVELAFPHGLPAAVADAVGELRVWTMLDGFLR